MIENNVEFSNIDLRYESLRLPNAKREKDLLASISVMLLGNLTNFSYFNLINFMQRSS